MLKVEQSPLRAATLAPESAPAMSGAQLWLPRPSLSSCARAILSRNTLGRELSEAQRHNHFPATPTCALIWYFSGDCFFLEPGRPAASDSPRTPLPGHVVFSGPRNYPLISWNPGPMHALTLLLLPDAVSLLTGIDPGKYLNRSVPAEQVFDARWLAFCAQVAQAPDDDRRAEHIEAFLDPLWQRARPDATLPGRIISDWSRGLALRAANSGLGRSTRQIERRIKQWTGQPLRELRGMGRSEQAFFEAITALENGALSWPEVADSAGFSDQSHLCRQTRRITGFSPDELRRRIVSDEGFWVYRLWGFSEGGAAD